jgi:hypothetical protein
VLFTLLKVDSGVTLGLTYQDFEWFWKVANSQLVTTVLGVVLAALIGYLFTRRLNLIQDRRREMAKQESEVMVLWAHIQAASSELDNAFEKLGCGTPGQWYVVRKKLDFYDFDKPSLALCVRDAWSLGVFDDSARFKALFERCLELRARVEVCDASEPPGREITEVKVDVEELAYARNEVTAIVKELEVEIEKVRI